MRAHTSHSTPLTSAAATQPNTCNFDTYYDNIHDTHAHTWTHEHVHYLDHTHRRGQHNPPQGQQADAQARRLCTKSAAACPRACTSRCNAAPSRPPPLCPACVWKLEMALDSSMGLARVLACLYVCFRASTCPCMCVFTCIPMVIWQQRRARGMKRGPLGSASYRTARCVCGLFDSNAPRARPGHVTAYTCAHMCVS